MTDSTDSTPVCKTTRSSNTRPGFPRGSSGFFDSWETSRSNAPVGGGSPQLIGRPRVAVSHKGVYFAIVGRENKGRPEAAEAIPESQWEEFIPRAKRLRRANQQAEGFKSRKKKQNLRDKRANEREYKDLRQIQQWMTEIPLARTYPDGTSREERLVMFQASLHQIHTFGPVRPDPHSGEDPIANVTDVTPHIIRSGRVGP